MGARLLPLLIVALAAIAWLRAPRPARARLVMPALVMGVSFLAAYGPLLRYYLANGHLFAARMADDGVLGNDWLARALAQGRQLGAIVDDQSQRGLLPFHIYADTTLFYALPGPLLATPSAILMGLGVTLALRHLRRSGYQLLYLWYLGATLVGGALMVGPPASAQFTGLAPVVCLFIALGVDACARAMTQQRRLARLLAGSLVALIALDHRHDELHVIEQQFPGGVRETLPTPLSREIILVYRLLVVHRPQDAGAPP